MTLALNDLNLETLKLEHQYKLQKYWATLFASVTLPLTLFNIIYGLVGDVLISGVPAGILFIVFSIYVKTFENELEGIRKMILAIPVDKIK